MKPNLIFRIIFCTVVFTSSAHGVLLLGQSPASDARVRGVVIDAESGEPIPYASIGILNAPIGTVASELGDFELVLNTRRYSDAVVRISAIGYLHTNYGLKDLTNPVQIKLQPTSHELEEIQVSGAKFGEREILGKNKDSYNATFYFQSNQLGTELGMELKADSRERLVKNLNFYLQENAIGQVSFRVHLYHYRPDSLSTMRELLPGNFIIPTDIKQGWLRLDLSGLGVILPADAQVVMALEWLEDHSGSGKPEDLQFGALLSRRGSIYVKQATQDAWRFFRKRYYGMQTKLAFYAEVSPAIVGSDK